MEELERKKDQDKHVPKFLHSTVLSLCSHQKTTTVSNSNLYTGKINEAQVCVGKSCLSEPESPACKTEEIRDNGKKEEIQDENDQDIYVPTFFIPPIPIISNGHAVDVDYAEIKSVNKAQVCVDDSFLSNSRSPDSESKEMGNMGIERSIASDTKCDPDKDAFGYYDGLKKSERYTMTEGLAMKESMERLNESSSQSSLLHLKNRRQSAFLRQKYQIDEMAKKKTQSFQPRKRAGKQPPLLQPPSPSSITDPPEVQMNLAFELSQPIPGPSYTLGAHATPPLERLPSHQLQDLAERISVILKDRRGPQSHEEDKPTGSEVTFDTIRVRLKQPLTQDTLENYFENKRKSGGGDIESSTIIKGTEMEVEEVLITFSESKDAMNCLQQQHIIDKKLLNVQKYDVNDPNLWEINKALVTGLNPVTTEDTLMNFLELAAGVEIEDLVRGAQEDVAIVVFAEKPDFAKMSKRCKEKKLEGNTLFVQMVENCHTIYVKGIDKSITYDLVENFFHNKRKSGGGDVEKVDYHPEDGYCIVYFENPSDAKDAAAKEKFTINDREIQAQMYFPCLGLPEQPMNWEDMPYVFYEGNEYIVKFVKNVSKECSQIEEALQKKFVKVEWPKSKSDFTVKLQCTVTKDVENAKEILKSWKEEAEVEMDRQMKKYVCQKHSTVPEAWPAFLAQLKTLSIDQPDRVAVFLEKKKHTVIVAGYEENSEALTRIILDLIKTEESKIQNQTEKIMKNIPLDFHKCQQLWKTHFGKKLTNDFPDLDFQVEINKKEVNLTGKPTEVNEALIMMHEYLMNTKSKSLNISKGRYEVFMKKEVKERFIAEMKAKGNKAVWSVTEDKVETTSLNSKMADEALEIFKELIPEKRIQMRDIVKVLTMHDWQACVKELRDKHDEKLRVFFSSSGVCVTATKDIFENVYKTIKHVLKICSEKCGIDCKVVQDYKR